MVENRAKASDRKLLWILALGVFGGAACMSVLKRQSELPVQAWDEGFGPTIPHDSFPSDCQLCHVGEDWTKIRADFSFDHKAETGVELNGAHANAQCLRCHNDRGPVDIFAKRGCAGCHEDFHRGQLGQACEQCHNENNWLPEGQFALHNQTRFPLVGSHAAVACFRCHENAQAGSFLGADTRCLSCHQQDLARARQPDHRTLGWVNDCERCHVPTTWEGAGFTHARFPLIGAHQSTSCDSCHSTGVFIGTPNQCDACHTADFQRARDPNHIANNFSRSCEQCHNTFAWQGARFNHAGITNNCLSCHQQDRNRAREPNHLAAGFSTACEQCHNTFAWDGARFDHAGITNNCVSCHQSDFNQTRNPNHVSSGFSTSCEQCHNTNSWQGANFNHTFRLRGPHNVSCQECHKVPSNFAVVSCTDCHEHRRAKADDKHSGVNGYVYVSAACIGCHPTGK